MYGKEASTACFALHDDRAPHQANDAMADREAEPRALAGLDARARLHEPFEETPHFVGTDSPARVFDLDIADARVPRCAKRDSARIRELARVTEKVDQHLSQLPLIAADELWQAL